VNSGLTNPYVNAFGVVGANLFAGTGDGIFLSTNSGTSWTAVNSGLTSMTVNAFAVTGPNLFAGTQGGGVFLSTNNGSNWTAVNSGLTSTALSALAVAGASLFAGTVGGVFVSTNGGSSWTAVNTGLINTSVYALVATGTNLFAGTFGGGVWRRPLSEIFTSARVGSLDVAGQFVLQQNYANPFNPSTTLEFSVPRSEYVTLKVFDILGREVSVLVDEYLQPGVYRKSWSADGQPSGIYLARMQAGEFSQTRRLALVK
jgi:ligand-binding sensor domain-containing protein